MVDGTSEERWLPIVGYEKHYEVSDRGQVRKQGKVMSTTDLVKGYIFYRFQVHGVRTRHAASKLVLTAFVGSRPEGMVARHLNDNRADNRLANLAWGTLSENSFDAVRNGRNHCANQVECGRGHKLIAPNLVPSLPHRRMCLACHMTHVNRSTDPVGGRTRFNRSKHGFLRRVGESVTDEADRRYALIMSQPGSG